MRRFLTSILVCSTVIVTTDITTWAEGPSPNIPAKSSVAWTLEAVEQQLAINPNDPYLQYAALQLARNEGKACEVNSIIERFNRSNWRTPRRRVDLFAVFTGALAVQESLQLETMRGTMSETQTRLATPKYNTVKVADLVGPQVKSHPWGKMLAASSLSGKKPQVSQLALCVPEDQYFVRFGSVNKLLEAAEAGDLWGTHLLSQAAHSAKTHETTKRIKAQLAIETDPLTRPFYDLVVESVALTGSDLNLRMGSDTTLLFKLKQPQVFRLRMDSFLKTAEQSRADAVRTTGKIAGVEFVHVSTPDRTVYVFSAYPRPDLHVRSNSIAALARVLHTIDGESGVKRLGESTEFKYIRTLMPLGAEEEHGFVYLSDPFIRRVVGAELKLTDVRRMFCYNHLRLIGHAAMLYRTQYGRPAASLEELAKGACAPGVFGEGSLRCPCGGKYSLSADRTTGVCSHHGHARAMTPCREIPLDRVTKKEARQYKQFVERYNQYWRTFFDPIAIRIQVTPKQYRAETIILPLIDNSIYSGMAAALGGEPKKLDALPVPEKNIFSVALKLDKASLMEKAGIKPPSSETQEQAKTKANIQASAKNLKWLALAMHNYHDTHRAFPSVANFDKSKRPLLSWRVHMLPHLEQNELYEQFHLDEPWNSPHNKKLIAKMPKIYDSPRRKTPKPGTTTYLAPVGEETVFSGKSKGTAIHDIRDGTSNTVMLLDAAEKHAVIWTKPDDWQYNPTKIRDVLFGRSVEIGLVNLCDGSVQGLPKELKDDTLKAFFTRAGEESITEWDQIRPGGFPRRQDPFGIDKLLGDNFDKRTLYEFITKGVGDQIGMHVYDAKPMFDFNLTGFLGETMRGFSGPRGPFGGEMFYISFLVASLNSPVYISVPIDNSELVDGFLENLDDVLAEKARQPASVGWFQLDNDFYSMTSARGDNSMRCFNIKLGPVKWRLFYARIGDALYVASKPFILKDLAELHKQSSAQTATEQARGPAAHAMVRIRPQNWKEVLPSFKLGWAEASRQSCLNNLGPLSSAARAELASSHTKPTAKDVRILADSVHGVHFFCPDGGQYQLSPDGKAMVCSLHGSASTPHQKAAPSTGSNTDRLMQDFGGITAALTFLDDGLHAVITIQRK